MAGSVQPSARALSALSLFATLGTLTEAGLAVLRLDFTAALQEALATLLTGTLARAGALRGC